MTRFDEAIASYTRCLSLRPQHVDAHLNRALTWLRQGNFALGWAAYESRLRKRSLSKRPQLMPAWNGFPPRGMRILLIAEQGLGDSLQFIRYAPLLKQMGATVLFECPEKLMKLFEGMAGIDALFPQGKEPPAHDVHAALLSLPGLLGTTLAALSEGTKTTRSVADGIPTRSVGTSSESGPNSRPGREGTELRLRTRGMGEGEELIESGFRAYIQADPARVERWGQELALYPGFRVGINWQGNTGYAGDFHRSMPLRHFAPLAAVPGVRLFSLQKFAGSEQLAEWGARFRWSTWGAGWTRGRRAGRFWIRRRS